MYVTEAERAGTQLLGQWMTCQEDSNAAAIALAASGKGTGIDVSQLDLASVFTLLLAAARVPDSESKQMKPARLVSNMMLVTSCPTTRQACCFMA